MRLLLDESQVGIVNAGPLHDAELFKIAGKAESPDTSAHQIEGFYNQGPTPQGSVIAFPNLITCQGTVVVMENGAMIGSHSSNPAEQKKLNEKMSQLIGENGGPHKIAQIYITHNTAERTPERGLDEKEQAARFGFQGKVRFVDAAQLGEPGSFIQFTAMPGRGGRCLVEGTHDRHLDYKRAALTMNVGDNPMKPVAKVGASVKPGEAPLQKLSQTKVKAGGGL